MRFAQLAEKAAFLKNDKSEVKTMCKIPEELQKETLLNNIRSLMKTMKLTAQQAMEALEIPPAKQKELLLLI